MDPVTLGLIAMGVGGGVKALGDLFDDTASRQAALTRKAADLKQSALEETMRRTEGSQTQVLSSTKARMAASGFSVNSKSFDDYLTGMAGEFQKQNAFQKQSGMASIELMREGADIMDDPTARYLRGATDLLGTGANILTRMK